MILEYARTDHINGIERKHIVKTIYDGFNQLGYRKVVFNLFGNSGVGKSFICRSIYDSDLIVARNYKVLIDLSQIVNNNIPGILQAVISKLDDGQFEETQAQLDFYYKSIDASKSDCLTKCVDVFIQELNHYANDCQGVLLIFDTFEVLTSDSVKYAFEKILNLTNENVGFLIAGIVKTSIWTSSTYCVNGFDESEIQDYMISRNSKMRRVFKKHGILLASQIRRYTDNGNPILCGLVSDWLLHCKDLNQQIDYLLASEKTSYKHLINWISDLNNKLKFTLRLTAFFNDRMTSDFLIALSDMDEIETKDCLLKMMEFSFVKSFSGETDREPQIVLHDVVASLIRTYLPFSKEELNIFAEKAISVYDKMIQKDRMISEAFRLEQSLRVEKVMCMIRNGRYEDALVIFDNEILDAIDVFNYSFVNQLIGEIVGYLQHIPEPLCIAIGEDQAKWKYMIIIAEAEVELSKYRSEKVFALYKKLKDNQLYKMDLYRALADNVFAKALINPCTPDSEETPADAIRLLNCSIKKLIKTRLDRRLVKSYYWLGNAYVRCGQNDKAQVAYERALSKSQTDVQTVMILLDMSKMVRLQQDLHEALLPLQKCDVLIDNIKKNKGKYFYYKGNIYRDLDDIAGATYYYSKAFEELSSGDDNFTLCELNLDYAWLQYIRDDIEEVDINEVKKYLDIGWDYAERYHFGSEYSEYYHILYEVQNYLGDYTNAFKNLDQAIDYAYRYSNIYMILDCLNHRVQRYYQEGLFDLIPDVIHEMENIEKSGCKIRVFRGRAKLVQADVYFDREAYELALQEYFDGFVIVALYGNSRTNVELFGDLFSKKGSLNLSRKEKIMECLRRVSEPDKYRRKFRNSWNKKNINYDYKYFLDCLKKEK